MERFNIYQLANSDSESTIRSFVVRKTEFQTIINALSHCTANGALQHELILGKKGSGKSTLLRRIEVEITKEKKLSKKFIPVNLAEEQASIYRLFDLFIEIIEELKCRFPFPQDIKNYHEFDKEENYMRYLYQKIHEFCISSKKRIVLLLDNFDRIIENFGADGNLLRDILINHSDIVVIAASTRIDEHFWQSGNPFYEFFRQHHLDALTVDEMKELLNHWAETDNIPVLKEFATKKSGKLQNIRFITDGLPRTFQFFMQIVVQNDYANERVDYLKIIMDKVTPLYRERLSNMPPQLRKMVMEMAFIREACTTKELVDKCKMESKLISANLNTLSERGVVEKIETDNRNLLYRISERFFNMWLIMTQGNPEQKRKAEWLSVFLEKWYDAAGLQEQKINFVEIRNYKKTVAFAISAENEDDRFNSFDLGNIDRVQTVYPEVEKYYLSAIEKGQVSAMFNLGNFYANQGKDEEAEKYYFIAIKRGHISAMYNLGVLYANQGNYAEAEKYYLSAVEEDEVSAMYNLGVFYANRGKNAEAEIYYLLAAENGQSSAMYNLGNLYSDKNNYAEAEKYYILAAEKRHVKAMYNLGNLYSNQNKFAEAEQYYRMAIEKGHVGAMSNLGILYSNRGKFAEAEKCYLLAIEKEYLDALYNLGILYYNQEKYSEAEKYYLLAIEKGYDRAMYNLGVLYDKWGKFAEAEKYYLLAIEKNNNDAIYNLASLYYHQNIKKADALQYIRQYEGCEDLRIILELWNRVFDDVEKRALDVVKQEPDTLLWFIIDLLIHQQEVTVSNLFNNSEVGKTLQDKFKVLHYISLLFNKKTEKNLSLKIPPEIKATINSVIEYIMKKEKFYGTILKSAHPAQFSLSKFR